MAVTNSSLEKEINGHVNRFFGFAIHGVTKYWKKRAGNGDDSIVDDNDDDVTECLESKALAFVDEIRNKSVRSGIQNGVSGGDQKKSAEIASGRKENSVLCRKKVLLQLARVTTVPRVTTVANTLLDTLTLS
jgi:hypothetical protein